MHIIGIVSRNMSVFVKHHSTADYLSLHKNKVITNVSFVILNYCNDGLETSEIFTVSLVSELINLEEILLGFM